MIRQSLIHPFKKSLIPSSDRLIFALDVGSIDTAKSLVNELGDSVSFYKIGLQLLMTGEYFDLIAWLKDKGKKVFVDLKFFDVPQTVQSAVAGLTSYDVDFATIHGNDSMIKAAAEAKHNLKMLAVTMLTSLDQGDINSLGFKVDIKEVVLSRAKNALACGCDGVVSSGLEVAALREHVSEELLVVCPGIRPLANNDDQKRTVDVKQAFENGADYIVVGRPIRESNRPKQSAERIQEQIAEFFN